MSYLTFIQHVIPGQKTVRVAVHSTNHGDLLGWIKWFGRWRQYAFFPEPGTVWNPECLKDVNDRIASLMEQRKRRCGWTYDADDGMGVYRCDISEGHTGAHGSAGPYPVSWDDGALGASPPAAERTP